MSLISEQKGRHIHSPFGGVREQNPTTSPLWEQVTPKASSRDMQHLFHTPRMLENIPSGGKELWDTGKELLYGWGPTPGSEAHLHIWGKFPDPSGPQFPDVYNGGGGHSTCLTR